MTSFAFQPWHLLMTILPGVMNQEQQRVIEYLRTETQVLKEKLGSARRLCQYSALIGTQHNTHEKTRCSFLNFCTA